VSRRQLAVVLGLLALAVWGSLLSSRRSAFDQSGPGTAGRPAVLGNGFFSSSIRTGGLDTVATRQAQNGLSAGLAESLGSPDPRVRIRALEAWALHPGDTLDPVTYALVDADELVRTRAQELLEEILARR